MNSSIAKARLNLPQRPAANCGRVQLAADRAFVVGDVISTADAAAFAYARKTLLHGRKLEPHDYRLVRRALMLIARPIGRSGGRGRAMQWVLKGG
jgi:glutathione S-transferase